MIEPFALISLLRNSDEYIEKIFLYGSCYKFYKFLSRIYPNSVPYINSGRTHVITKIGPSFYDITGPVQNVSDFRELTPEDHEYCSRWSFWKHNALLLGNCENCEEPFIFRDKAPEKKRIYSRENLFKKEVIISAPMVTEKERQASIELAKIPWDIVPWKPEEDYKPKGERPY